MSRSPRPAHGRSRAGATTALRCGTTAGWHSFRHVISDNSGGFGPAANHAYHTVGYKDPTMSAYARFNVKNLKMRPAADMGDANNANTIRWSHYKGTATDVTASTFKRDDFAWDFCCITNNLQKLTWYGNNDTTYINGYTVNRYEGWFYVTAENAGKAWTFRSNYDDRAALWIDGVDSGLTGDSNNTLSYTVTLAQGWHKFTGLAQVPHPDGGLHRQRRSVERTEQEAGLLPGGRRRGDALQRGDAPDDGVSRRLHPGRRDARLERDALQQRD